MEELIAKLEALTGPCFGVEQEIGRMMNANATRSSVFPAYTASIDAAMTLADPGAGLYLNRYWLREGEAWSCSLVTGGIPSNPSQTFETMDARLIEAGPTIADAPNILGTGHRVRLGRRGKASTPYDMQSRGTLAKIGGASYCGPRRQFLVSQKFRDAAQVREGF